ncbi:homing endonuclease associated repeat-containing protein, partial [Cytobacillus praedii]
MGKRVTNIGFTKEYLINYFWDFYKKNKRYLTQTDLKSRKLELSATPFNRHWGTYTNFLKEMNVLGDNGWYICEEKYLQENYSNKPKDEIINSLMKKRNWQTVTQKANSMGLKRDKVIIYGENPFNKEDIEELFWKFYEENKRYPEAKEIDKLHGNRFLVSRNKYFGNWNSLLKEIGVISLDNTDGWYICDENVLIEKYETNPQDEIINELMVKRSWGTIKTKASELGLRRNTSITKRQYTNDYLINCLLELANDLGRTPRDNDIREIENFPSMKVYQKRFGSWNSALKIAGLRLNTEFNITKEEIINRAKDFFKTNNRSPYWNELNLSRTVYEKYWCNFPEMLEEAMLPLNKKTRIDHFKTDEELIEDYLNLYKILGRIPMANDVNNYANMASFSTYKLRLGGYEEIWKKCNIDNTEILDETTYGFICLDKNGEICKSYAEMVIT